MRRSIAPVATLQFVSKVQNAEVVEGGGGHGYATDNNLYKMGTSESATEAPAILLKFFCIA